MQDVSSVFILYLIWSKNEEKSNATDIWDHIHGIQYRAIYFGLL